jgi:hypothetical protein
MCVGDKYFVARETPFIFTVIDVCYKENRKQKVKVWINGYTDYLYPNYIVGEKLLSQKLFKIKDDKHLLELMLKYK